MATSVLPQVRVFQEFSVVPAAVANPLRSHVSGPHAKLIRYAETGERNSGRLGYYDNLSDTAYAWPAKPAGAIVDPTYSKLWMRDALLKYFQDTISQGSAITKTTGYNNRVRSATVNFAANGTAYPLAASLLDRGVKVGDVAKVRGLNGDSDPVVLWTYVKSLIGDDVAASVAAVAADASNAGAQSLSATVAQTAGAENCITATVNAAGYDALRTGYINETYRVIVTQSSVGSDHTTGRLRVISGSGTDDDDEVVPAAAGSPTAIGANGATLTLDVSNSLACSASAGVDDVTTDDLIAGQEFLVTVHQQFTVATLTSGGTYDSRKNTTYVVEISRGGSVDGSVLPQFKVTTTNGVDLSGPTTISATATDYAVGTLGVVVRTSSLRLRKGDRYFVDVTGIATGPIRTIELGHSIDSGIAGGSEVDLTLFIRKPLLEIPADRTDNAPLTNWDTTATELTVNSGITAFDESWTDSGAQVALSVFAEESKRYGELFSEVRYWLSDLANGVGSISDSADLDTAISGPLHPDNPLKYGVFKALENANGVEVLFTSVANPDSPSSWTTVIAKLLGRNDVHCVVPLTRDATVIGLFEAHVDAASTADRATWRTMIVNLAGVPEIPVVSTGSTVPGHATGTTSDGEVAKATVTDDADTGGSQYTVVLVSSGNVELITQDVRPGDIFRTNYTSDGFGNEEYSEYVIDSVVSEDEFKLLSGPDAPINVASKFEIWRSLSADEEADEIGANAAAYGNRRVSAVWPDSFESGGEVLDGLFLCCAVAGLRSGVLPQQGLTNLAMSGVDAVPRTTEKFGREQLDRMAAAGVYIVTKDRLGPVYARQAITTADYGNVDLREEMVTRNRDSISYRYHDHFAPFIGVTNVTPVVQARLEQENANLMRTLQTETETVDLGGQIISGTLVSLARSLVFKDRFEMKVSFELPRPFNNLDISTLI